MGIQINGSNDTISATDGGLSISGQSIDNANLNLSQNLNVTGVGTFGNLTLTSSVSTVPFIVKIGGSEVARIDSSGRVGIGTSIPQHPLQINAGTAQIRLEESSASSKRLELWIDSSGVATIAANQSSQSIAFQTTGTERLRIDSSGRVGIGASSSPGGADTRAWIDQSSITELGLVINASGGTKIPTLWFRDASATLPGRIVGQHGLTLATTSSATTAVTIDNSQRMGIGTSTPNRKLEISDATVDNFVRVNTTGATKSGIEFTNGGTAYAQIYFNNTAPYDFSLLQQYTTGSLILGTNNTERLRIDSSGRVLVGTSTATNQSGVAGLLQVEATSGNEAAIKVKNNQNTSTAAYIALSKSRGTTVNSNTIVQDGDNIGSIIWFAADGTDTASWCAEIMAQIDGAPGVNDVPGRLVFSTTADGSSSTTEAMRINNQRELLIGTTTRTANGGVLQVSNGITFPATQSACSDANTLDDYEEGTWTPAWSFSTSGSVTIVNGFAKYTKIGRQVTVACRIYTSAITSPSGNATITGLPFSAADNYYSCSIGEAGLFATDMPNIKAQVNSNTLRFTKNITSATSGSGGELLGSDFATGTVANVLSIVAHYFV